MTTVISVENLSKSYRLGQITGRTLAQDLNRWWARARYQPDPYLKIGQADHSHQTGEEIWALKDVSFTVQQGEVLGIIGRNGAGKSTLLKILSRVTAPTSGVVKVKGRIASLLEVGTGFHPELTGRENVYLNGAILGMSKFEVGRKFDEIVDFAEVEQFIDTPVKRYSSGMYVRLAFAVAAHLEPEILVVDEVLAVGDAAFQKKCLGKMGEVAEGGRTVLFVSHNMASIASLCTRGLVIDHGLVVADADTVKAIEIYQSNLRSTFDFSLSDRKDRRGSQEFKFLSVDFRAPDGISPHWIAGGEVDAILGYISNPELGSKRLSVSFIVSDMQNHILFTCSNDHEGTILSNLPPVGELVCHIQLLPLAPNTYNVGVWCGTENMTLDYVQNAAQVLVVDGDFFGTGNLPNASRHGAVLVGHSWTVRESL